VRLCTVICLRSLHDAHAEEVELMNRLALTWENQLEAILIVLLVLFLLGGGGWGYSRWRKS
jgi:hypothetical protein